MAAQARFALIAEPAKPGSKGLPFASLDELATEIHRRRKGRTLHHLNAGLELQGDAKPRQGVSVWAVDAESESAEYLGWCWLDGAQRNALMTALAQQHPDVHSQSVAA